MRIVLKILGAVVILLVLVAAGGLLWASNTSSGKLTRTFETHTVDFPIPFPLTPEELAELSATDAGGAAAELDLEVVARRRARERGKHLVDSRYPCRECHGIDFGGGVMVDAFPIGTLLGPNITSGSGGKSRDYTPADWDRIVRHGVKPDGTPAIMPSDDFARMSDQELSDVVAYIQGFPQVDHEVAAPKLGPLGLFLMATDNLHLTADMLEEHDRPHAVYPPPTEASVEFGDHLAAVCAGCHGPAFAGGPIAGGDPSWAPARNLTPHDDGLAGWTYDQFVAAMTEGRRPDGSALLAPMTLITPYAQQMADVELEALWLYLQSLPPLPTPAG